MPFTLTRALRVLASSLGLAPSTTGRRIAAAAPKTVPPSSRSIRGANRRSSSKTKSNNAGRKISVGDVLASAVSAALEPLEGRAMMSATYYVSPSGNDSNRGTSASAPWKSLAKVSSSTFTAGDEVLFQGGATFDGTLHMYKGGGTSGDPVVYGSYGSGRATINSGTADAVMTYNVGGFKIENLVIVGKSNGNNAQEGLRIEANEKNTDLPAITVTGCDISGYYGAGLCLLGDVTGAGWTSESITYNTVHNNVVAGIFTSAAVSNELTGVDIGYDTVYDNPGTRSLVCSGNGIMAGNLEGGLIEHDVAYNNGDTGSGGVGIWAYDSDRVTIQYCASYDNHTEGVDGDGFDFDADTSNSVMQYNYAANNDGGGFLNDQWKNDNVQANNVIRFNIAQNNGHKGSYGDLEVWGKVINAEFYNNTVYDSLSTSAIRVHNATISSLHADGVHFANNVIVTTGGAAAVDVTASMFQGTTGLTFTGNDYYATNGKPTMIMGSKTYTSLAAFQAAGYEKVGSTDVGSSANPLLVAAGSGVTSITTGTNLASYLSGYQLQKASTVAKTARQPQDRPGRDLHRRRHVRRRPLGQHRRRRRRHGRQHHRRRPDVQPHADDNDNADDNAHPDADDQVAHPDADQYPDAHADHHHQGHDRQLEADWLGHRQPRQGRQQQRRQRHLLDDRRRDRHLGHVRQLPVRLHDPDRERPDHRPGRRRGRGEQLVQGRRHDPQRHHGRQRRRGGDARDPRRRRPDDHPQDGRGRHHRHRRQLQGRVGQAGPQRQPVRQLHLRRRHHLDRGRPADRRHGLDRLDRPGRDIA